MKKKKDKNIEKFTNLSAQGHKKSTFEKRLQVTTKFVLAKKGLELTQVKYWRLRETHKILYIPSFPGNLDT